jgi:ABC-type phosphate transport system substrate-binding protein
MSANNEYAPMQAWLNEYTNKKTRSNAENNFKVYLTWTKKTPKQLLDEFDQIKIKSQIP